MIRLNCFFQAKRGKYNEALEAAILLTAKTQKHEGMISYDVFESATRKDIFMFCETWESEEALAKHAATPEFKECVGIIESCGENIDEDREDDAVSGGMSFHIRNDEKDTSFAPRHHRAFGVRAKG